MGENSKIQWTDHTFNPWIGCQRVSPGCQNCYAEQLMDHRYRKVKWGPQGERKRTSESYWRQPLKWNKYPWYQCTGCGWRGYITGGVQRHGDYCRQCRNGLLRPTRGRVFCGSLCDVFEGTLVVVPWRVQLFEMIAKTPNLDWMLLTKRPENVMRMITECGYVAHVWLQQNPHVWIGTSIEDQRRADERIPVLLQIPAAVRFVSAEPLLGSVRLDDNYNSWLTCTGIPQIDGHCCEAYAYGGTHYHGIDWVIIGGESGPGARPMDVAWARSLVEQCRSAGVAPFVKQMGTVWAREHGAKDAKGGNWEEWEEQLRVREMPDRSR